MMTFTAWLRVSTFLACHLPRPARFVGFQVGVDDAQHRAGRRVVAAPQQIADDVVGLDGAAAAWALSQRGVTDVLVAERNTVGSGMTGKSSGIVRCHYGVWIDSGSSDERNP